MDRRHCFIKDSFLWILNLPAGKAFNEFKCQMQESQSSMEDTIFICILSFRISMRHHSVTAIPSTIIHNHNHSHIVNKQQCHHSKQIIINQKGQSTSTPKAHSPFKTNTATYVSSKKRDMAINYDGALDWCPVSRT
mmetsp:Transcript_23857/g.42693  ORF Transcript_23857/g.42693 Transcript_23857/m.42693 type:complete len:136 (+) Transcript_23857:545-952(+)